MYSEFIIKKGDTVSMKKIKTTLTDITNNTYTTNEYSAIIKKSKITYHNDNNKETIYIKDKNIIIERETDEYLHTMNFTLNKLIPSSYYVKQLDMYLDIDILTKQLDITASSITIKYEIPSSKNEFIYKVEMWGNNMNIKEELTKSIEESLHKLNIKDSVDIIIEIPKNKDHGDYSTNIAFLLAKIKKTNPMTIAQELKDNITNKNIENITVLAPGFINFKMNKNYLVENINTILKEKNNYGKNKTGNNTKINIEYVSANPTGILHVGHARGATYGDSLSRILTSCGYNVTREYYINDAGNQMNNLGISIKVRYLNLCGIKEELPEDGYHGKEIIEIAKDIYDKYNTTKQEEDISFFKKYGLDILLNQIKQDLDKYRVNFDIWSSEQSIYDKGLVDKTISKLKNSGKCYISEGALWLKTTDYGDEKDRVLIKNDGTYTYFLPDIAYHSDKIQRGYAKLIDVLGADHHGYIKRLHAGLDIVGYDSSILDIKILQMVRLIKNNEEVKLSKRTGKTITMNDLIDEVGVNATRYFFASHALDTQMDFNLDLATKQNNDNPIYYIEYANARISKVLQSAKNYNINNIDKYTYLLNDNTYNILNKLYEFENVVISAGEKRLPHLIATYCYELATLFHSYYTKEKLLTDNEEETKEKLALIQAVKIVLNNALDLIGIIPREEM